MGDETSSAAASMHTFVGSWRLFQFPCGEKLPLRHWPPSAFLVRVDSCVETKALICLALWQWLLGAAIVRSPQPKLFPASIVYIGTTAVGGAPSMPGMAWGCQKTQLFNRYENVKNILGKHVKRRNRDANFAITRRANKLGKLRKAKSERRRFFPPVCEAIAATPQDHRGTAQNVMNKNCHNVAETMGYLMYYILQHFTKIIFPLTSYVDTGHTTPPVEVGVSADDGP